MNDFDDENYLSEEQEKKDKRMQTIKYIGISLLIILIVIIILFLLKGCNVKKDKNGDLINNLLEAGKEYYDNNEYLMPASKGDCSTVSLKILKDYELLDKDEYEECDESATLVKVCKLESGSYHWVPLLTCDSYKSDDHYLSWKEGDESDLIDGKSDVRFLYLGKYLDLTNASLGEVKELWKSDITLTNYKTLKVTNYYSYRDKEYIWNLNTKYYYTSTGDKTKASDVKEYYKTSPKSGYTKKDSEDATVAKWFTVVSGGARVYWEDEDGNPYSKNQPSPEYNYYTGGKYETVYASRTFTKTGEVSTKAPTHMWECASTEPGVYNMYLYEACGEDSDNPTHTIYVRDFYTCDNGVSTTSPTSTCSYCTTGQLNGDKTACGTYTKWVQVDSCTGGADVCQSIVITVYKWYKIENEVRSYYPSTSATASGEKVYYKTAPVSGAQKDLLTQTTGYKWYKTVSGQTSDYSVKSPEEGATKTSKYRWTSWTNYSTVKPSATSDREIKSKQKIKFQEILSTTTEENWKNLSDDYLTEQEMITKFTELGKTVTSLSDISASGDMKYELKLYYRNLSEEE